MWKNIEHDLAGQRFGKLIAIREAEPRYRSNGKKMRMYECKCDCGNTTIVCAWHLKNGHTKSCGCYKSEASTEKATTHGQTYTRLYNIWSCMKKRCGRRHDYAHVSVCEEWQKFEPFYEWSMSHGYADNLTIDRIDGKGNYEPSNCRWATVRQQANNVSTNRRYELYGATFTIAEWARMFEMNYTLLRQRLDRGWDIERALTVPSRNELQRSAGTRI